MAADGEVYISVVMSGVLELRANAWLNIYIHTYGTVHRKRYDTYVCRLMLFADSFRLTRCSYLLNGNG